MIVEGRPIPPPLAHRAKTKNGGRLDPNPRPSVLFSSRHIPDFPILNTAKRKRWPFIPGQGTINKHNNKERYTERAGTKRPLRPPSRPPRPLDMNNVFTNH